MYLHRRYESLLGPSVDRAKKCLPTGFQYTVVKLHRAKQTVSFIRVVGFDTEPEPAIGELIVVRSDGSCRHMAPPDDPYIYHHKWLFVADDYNGFDVEESKARSRTWIALSDVDRTRIGRKSYWDTEVFPRLSIASHPT